MTPLAAKEKEGRRLKAVPSSFDPPDGQNWAYDVGCQKPVRRSIS